MDANFSVAIHTLVLISEADVPMSSREIGRSAGVNASQIRKIAGCLRQAGIIASRTGIAGFELCRPADEITLSQVWDAVYGPDSVMLFCIHRNPNDQCKVGRHIRPVLTDVFAAAEREVAEVLDRTVLADVIADMRKRLAQEEMLPAGGKANEGSRPGTI